MRNFFSLPEAIMDDRHPALENSSPLEPFIDRFAKELVQERIDNGHIDLKNMSFAEIEMLNHQIARRVAQHLGHEMTGRQSELYSDDYCCPTTAVRRAVWTARRFKRRARFTRWMDRPKSSN